MIGLKIYLFGSHEKIKNNHECQTWFQNHQMFGTL